MARGCARCPPLGLLLLLLRTGAPALGFVATTTTRGILPATASVYANRGGSALVRAAADGGSDGLPNTPVRAPRRIRKGAGSAPGRRGEGGSEGGGGGVRRGGTLSPKGKAAIAARPQGKADAVRELQRLYITGGSQRGRKIVTPEVYMRPMMSRVREALFSMLTYTNVLRDSSSHLDLFSGSGCVGLEALSRGVGTATFVDFSPVCAGAIRKNAETLGFGERVQVVEGRVDTVLTDPARFGLTKPFDLLTITPPYEEVVYAELMEQVAQSPLLDEDTIVVVEYPVELGCFPPTLADGKLVGLRNRRYGRTVLGVYVCRPSGRLDLSPYSEEFVSL